MPLLPAGKVEFRVTENQIHLQALLAHARISCDLTLEYLSRRTGMFACLAGRTYGSPPNGLVLKLRATGSKHHSEFMLQNESIRWFTPRFSKS